MHEVQVGILAEKMGLQGWLAMILAGHGKKSRGFIDNDEVILFSSGLYKVRSGDFWRVYTAYGQRLGNVWGDSVEHMQNGLIRCVRAGNVHYYDIDGNEHR